MARTETENAEREDESLGEREKRKKKGEEGNTAMAGWALSWFAVGCYYYCIKKYDQSRRYFRYWDSRFGDGVNSIRRGSWKHENQGVTSLSLHGLKSGVCPLYCVDFFIIVGSVAAHKAVNLEGTFLAAWMGQGNAYAALEEGDQAMLSYRTAARLFPGCHLPALYIGMEHMRTHSFKLAEQEPELKLKPFDRFRIDSWVPDNLAYP
ncbi:hypothetical protein Cgig2_022660 [Carnegiea gigantea]|uniref:Uncharacterized protein n=1 Tax=Carnegiea gigantea TaxID=171969 RepID=A0A9Q1JKQ1_9CARY|nr:hypothetical protein Cgig2_022660 [Carnegiea gigantea]